ncbi:MAG: alpha/beta hydrolase-fold protein [Acidobacteriota bacterium]
MPRRPIALLVLLLGVLCAVAAAILLGDWRSDRYRLRSEALRETRRYLVSLPEGYDTGACPCPLLVLLDGGDQKQHSAERTLYARSREVLAALRRAGFPPIVLVGVENRNRVKDMTPVERPDLYVGGGGSLAFMRFIETELVPRVVERWRIGDTRILYGESYAGLFVLDALARGERAFTDYVAVSPAVGTWPDGLREAFRRRPPGAPDPRSLFIVYGEKDGPLIVDHTPGFARDIAPALPAGLRFSREVLPGEGHSPERSLERALRFIFAQASQRVAARRR